MSAGATTSGGASRGSDILSTTTRQSVEAVQACVTRLGMLHAKSGKLVVRVFVTTCCSCNSAHCTGPFAMMLSRVLRPASARLLRTGRCSNVLGVWRLGRCACSPGAAVARLSQQQRCVSVLTGRVQSQSDDPVPDLPEKELREALLVFHDLVRVGVRRAACVSPVGKTRRRLLGHAHARVVLQFSEARYEIEEAEEVVGQTYFSEDFDVAEDAVEEALEAYSVLLDRLGTADRPGGIPGGQRGEVQRAHGLKVEQLKGELQMLWEKEYGDTWHTRPARERGGKSE